MLRRPTYDTILSGCLFALFAGLSAYAYAAILRVEAPSHVFMRSIAEGEKKFQIRHADRCIGEISTTLARGENTFVQSRAEADATYGQVRTTAKIIAHASFNPLGQMVESGTEILAKDLRILIRSKDINPIQFQISATFGAKHYEFNLSAPGPVLLKSEHGNLYQIEYSQFHAGDGSFLRGMGSNLLSQADLAIVDSSTSDLRCTPSERSSLDVASLLLRANVKTEALQRFLPGFIQ
ncbi:MAG: hypothetical protein J0M12_01730 [Deltaproteobacteria bacterium]|nr:hypothetical protein [Deltaproteobacteria bacterium]